MPNIARTKTYDRFNEAMDKLGSFECSPRIAIALSGGSDSTAVLYLLRKWVNERCGKLIALIVDHGLRGESANEAYAVCLQARSAGVEAHVLTWKGPKPCSAIQSTARRFRYDLLGEWCQSNNVLHLATGHHRDDQVETIRMRQGHNSGPDGLSGMAFQRETTWGRIIRPSLDMPKSKLRSFLKHRNLPWIEDPSNSDMSFERVRIRNVLAKESDQADSLISFAKDRLALDHCVAKFLAKGAVISPFGYASMNRSMFDSLGFGSKMRVLGTLCSTISGSEYQPRRASICGAIQKLVREDFSGYTLGGCQIVKEKNNLYITRQAGRCESINYQENGVNYWDGRFVLRSSDCVENMCIGPLRLAALDEIAKIRKNSFVAQLMPRPALISLPALFAGATLRAVPHLHYVYCGRHDKLRDISVNFRPKRAVSSAPFAVV